MVEHNGLTECPNPLHVMQIGKLMIGLQVAQDYWAIRDKSGNMARKWISFETVKAESGDEAMFSFVFLRLWLAFGWQSKEASNG